MTDCEFPTCITCVDSNQGQSYSLIYEMIVCFAAAIVYPYVYDTPTIVPEVYC